MEKRLAATKPQQETPAKAKPVLPEPAKPAPEEEPVEEKVYQPRRAKPEASAELAKTATATLADAVGDRDVAKVAGFIGDLFSGGIGLSSSKKPEYRQKAPDSKGLSPVKKPVSPPSPSAPIRDKADRTEYQDNFNEIKKLNRELWASRRGKKRPGLIGKIIRWRMESVFFTKKIKESQKCNAEIKARAEAQLLNPDKILSIHNYNQFVKDYCALAIKKCTITST